MLKLSQYTRVAAFTMIVCAASIGCQQTAPLAAGPELFAAPPVVSGGQAPSVAIPVGPSGAPLPEPGIVPGSSSVHANVTNREWAWEAIVDKVDDYFRIEREQQVQLVGNVLTEGRIDTFPQLGATLVEPHRIDSVGSYNRWESTFQTIRRRAVVRVIPDPSGYLVDVEVLKELEDLPRPEHSTAGAASFRSDSSLPDQIREPVSRTELSPYWIPLGRDTALEQQLASEIKACLDSHAQ
ncbi:hypothetical protein [Adhaeretor mobilis]|uniref:Uncharacterized protein n=1 Tax=Adhaeretor mobilis TaxID=1930276 RepID=A0A517MZL5_9BACT|nr:hypothetical protein [Adhaeretor mobilis]QDT00323.1 hypothetical protein HG15A2_36590 [Adhaeretor mobilis]